MANGYNPMQFVTGLSRIAQQSGAQGKRWEGQQMGLSRVAIQSWLNKRANQVSDAARGLGIVNLLSKPIGWATQAGVTALTGNPWAGRAAGGAVAGTVNKIGGHHFTKDLDTSGMDMSGILYGRDAAEQAESTALSAINQLIDRVNPSSIETAITTPLQYETFKNIFSGIPGSEKALDPTAAVTDDSVNRALSNSTIVNPNTNDVRNPFSLTPETMEANVFDIARRQLSQKTGAQGTERKSFSNLLSYFMKGMQSNNNLSTDPYEEELKINPYQAYKNQGSY